jgi:hypothetical protein
MLIDDEIELAEKMEKQDRELGFNDPHGGNLLLTNLLALSFTNISWQTDQKFRTKVFLLGRKIENLVLIVRRLRNAVSLPLQEGSMETKNKRHIEIDIESFFYFSFSILDNIARLTPIFYKPESEGTKSRSFRLQRKWFIDHPEKDPEYSEYLRTRTSWFEDLETHRVQLSHYHPLITFLSKEHILTFGTHENEKGFINNYPVLKYVNEKSSALLDFIIFYGRHFGK